MTQWLSVWSLIAQVSAAAHLWRGGVSEMQNSSSHGNYPRHLSPLPTLGACYHSHNRGWFGIGMSFYRGSALCGPPRWRDHVIMIIGQEESPCPWCRPLADKTGWPLPETTPHSCTPPSTSHCPNPHPLWRSEMCRASHWDCGIQAICIQSNVEREWNCHQSALTSIQDLTFGFKKRTSKHHKMRGK